MSNCLRNVRFSAPRLNQNQETDAPDAAQRAMRRVAALALVALVQLVQPTAASFDPLASFRPAKLPRRDSPASLDSPPRDPPPPPPPPPPLSPRPPPPEPPATVRVQAESPPAFYFQPPEGALENRGGRDRAFDDQYQPPYDDDDDDYSYEGDAAHSTLQTAPSHLAVATNSFLMADRVYDKYAGVANPMETMYVRQGKVGARLQDATWLLAEPFADKPTAIDDYLRCSTLLRSCTPGEVLRRCTYEPRGAWYRERRSRTNAPLDWPYCEPDLVNVYFKYRTGN